MKKPIKLKNPAAVLGDELYAEIKLAIGNELLQRVDPRIMRQQDQAQAIETETRSLASRHDTGRGSSH